MHALPLIADWLFSAVLSLTFHPSQLTSTTSIVCVLTPPNPPPSSRPSAGTTRYPSGTWRQPVGDRCSGPVQLNPSRRWRRMWVWCGCVCVWGGIEIQKGAEGEERKRRGLWRGRGRDYYSTYIREIPNALNVYFCPPCNMWLLITLLAV